MAVNIGTSHLSDPTPIKAQSRSEAGDGLWGDLATFKRDRILQGAALLFFERGYLQTSMEVIAERLGASKPFIYYHFKSKVVLLVAICEMAISEALAATVKAVSADGGPKQRFEEFVRGFTSSVLKHHRFTAIYFREEINLPREARDRINVMRKSIDHALRSLLNEGIESGDFELEDPQIGGLIIEGMSSYAFAWYRETGRLDQQKITDSIVKMTLKLVSVTAPPKID